jgi:hypothetical protein
MILLNSPTPQAYARRAQKASEPAGSVRSRRRIGGSIAVIRVLLARVAVYRQRAIDDDVKPNRVARHVYVALTSQKAALWSGTVQTVRALIRDAEVAGSRYSTTGPSARVYLVHHSSMDLLETVVMKITESDTARRVRTGRGGNDMKTNCAINHTGVNAIDVVRVLSLPACPATLEVHRGRRIERQARPALAVYLEHSDASPDAHGTAEPIEFVSIRVGVEVDGWEIGHEVCDLCGVLRLTKARLWRRIGEHVWRSQSDGGDGPTRAQIRQGAIEPYLDVVTNMLAEARSLYPDWAAQMQSWPLTRLKSSRGQPRAFDSADVEKEEGEDDDTWVAQRLNVDWQTPKKRRWRDRSNQLRVVPWAITSGRLRALDADQSSPGCLIEADAAFVHSRP